MTNLKTSYSVRIVFGLFIGISGCSKSNFQENTSSSEAINKTSLQRSYTTTNKNEILGNIDGVWQAPNGSYQVRGWACIKGLAKSIPVHLYIGGSYGHGGTLITGLPADQVSEHAVASACGTTFNNYRFVFDISAETLAAYPDATIYVHGINDAENNLINSSGQYRLPELTTGPVPNVIIPISDQSPTTSPSSTGQIMDQKNQNPFRATSELTIADPSEFRQSEYPGCMGKSNVFPTACRGTTSIVGQHTYAQRLDFKGWGTEQGFCQGSTGSTPLIYATTNDAMNPASFNYQRLGGLDMAISEIPGDFNPADPNCKKWGEAPSGIVSVRIAQKGFSRKGRACELTPGKMYYINVKPAGNETATCGLGAPEACLFTIYTMGVPIRTTSCR